jgi:hypothetical protein
MKHAMYKIRAILLIAVLFCSLQTFAAVPAHAEAVAGVTPAVFDLKLKPRDIEKQSINIINLTDARADIYIFVNPFSPEQGKTEFLDRSRVDATLSLAHWISVTRAALEFGPHEKRTIEIEIQVPPNAAEGVRHAVISFGYGATRDSAEQAVAELPQIMMNVEVVRDIKEKLQLNGFSPLKNIFFSFPLDFSVELENIGASVLSSQGEVRLYNRKGEEVASLPLQKETSITPKEKKVFSLRSALALDAGRYKAMLDIDYGSKQRQSLHDTVYFWVVPWSIIVVVVFLWLAAVALIGIMVYKRMSHRPKPAKIVSCPTAPPPSLARSQRVAPVAEYKNYGSEHSQHVVDLRAMREKGDRNK